MLLLLWGEKRDIFEQFCWPCSSISKVHAGDRKYMVDYITAQRHEMPATMDGQLEWVRSLCWRSNSFRYSKMPTLFERKMSSNGPHFLSNQQIPNRFFKNWENPRSWEKNTVQEDGADIFARFHFLCAVGNFFRALAFFSFCRLITWRKNLLFPLLT